MHIPSVLTIAGSDPSGGAGIQVDIKTCMRHNIYSMAIPTCLTVQNTRGIRNNHVISSTILQEQLNYLLEDLLPSVIKIGAIGSKENLHVISTQLQTRQIPVVWDPVFVSSSGAYLLEPSAITEAKEHLLPLVTLTTPNAHEFSILYDLDLGWTESSPACLRTDGDGDGSLACDILYTSSGTHRFYHPRHKRTNTHGTGCTLSTAIACNLAMGQDIPTSCHNAIAYVQRLIESADQYNHGTGKGSLGHEYTK